METARTIAFRIVRRVEGQRAYASILLQNLPERLPREEIRLVTELVYGVLRHRLHDEHILASLAARPVGRIDPAVALLFRIAAHQILRLGGIPDHAAVHEAVEMAKSRAAGGGSKRAAARARFLNAVLRRLCREKDALPLPPWPGEGARPGEVVRAFSIRWSHPRWIVKRWIQRLGRREAASLLEASNRRPPVFVRIDPGRGGLDQVEASLAAEGITSDPVSFPPGFLRIRGGAPHRTTVFREGRIYIQDPASGIVPRLLACGPGERVLDACAAPGGKALIISGDVGPAGRVVAADLHPARAGLVARNARRHGAGNILSVVCDAAAPPFQRPFDAVLLDAPCSGTGVFRRDPETRFRVKESDLIDLARKQRAIFHGVAGLVKRGGRLVYSVCSLEPEEGEDRVREFLQEHPGFSREEILDRVGGRREMLGEDGGLRTWPHRHDMDGFYAASLRRHA